MIDIPIIKPENVSVEELEELSVEIKKEEKKRKKLANQYEFTKEDISELYRRIGEGEELDDVERDISERGIERLREQPKIVVPVKVVPVITPTIQKSEKKISKGRGILKAETSPLQHPPGECCTTLCDMLNNDIQGFTELVGPNKDQKLMFDTLVELRRQLFINGSCQCTDGIYSERYGIPLREKQIEDCQPSACEILNKSIEEYDSILLPTHTVMVRKDKLYDFRKKLYHNGNFKCVETEEQLEKPRPGGAIDPVLLGKLSQIVKRAEKEGWIE